MTDTAIRAVGLGKRYRIGARQQYRALRDTLADAAAAPLRGLRRALAPDPGHGAADADETLIWSLRDVSLEVARGQAVGLIGRNGAGKSTFLKILSRITEPTEGRVELFGRVGSLLEVGTGFHPELTGRENIFLNGAILGMARAEIRRKFDEIVAFAEVERFIDTPVKRYSSGMYVRLAFAVAAHLETEILLVDEVLAVGDVRFQRKCLDKMGDVARAGRTVLFVSHNMAGIQALCDSAFLLEGGRLVMGGGVRDVVAEYLRRAGPPASEATSSLADLPRDRGLRPVLAEGYLNDRPLAGDHSVLPEDPLDLRLRLRLPEPMRGCTVGVHFEDEFGVRIYAVHTRWQLRAVDLAAGEHEARAFIPSLPLVPGQYYLSLGFTADGQQVDWLDRVACVEVAHSDVYGTGELPGVNQGYFLSRAEWSVRPVRPSAPVAVG